jgi:hypothetical protein
MQIQLPEEGNHGDYTQAEYACSHLRHIARGMVYQIPANPEEMPSECYYNVRSRYL